MELSSRELSFLEAELRDVVDEVTQSPETKVIAEEISGTIRRELKIPNGVTMCRVTIDRESNSGNLIARESSSVHIRKVEFEDGAPKPGEVWRGFEVESEHGHTEVVPIEHLTTIKNYDSVTMPGENPRKRSPPEFVKEKAESSERQDREAASNHRVSSGDSEVIGEKNDLLNQGKL